MDIMKSTLPALGALAFVASLAACSGDEGAPGPGGTGTSSSSGSAADGGGGTDENGKLKTGTVGCNLDSECASGHCFLGNMQHFCTLVCTTDNATTVCESPLTGTCNKQGYCKRD